jgi:MYXO-CTERM domain-containing protein
VKRALLAAVVALVSAACSGAPDASAPAVAPARSGPLAAAFARSAQSAGVPRDLLVAIAQTEGGLDMPARREKLDPDSHVPVAGPLQLRRGAYDTLARGAALVGATELDLRRDTDLALEAGARVLAEIGARTGAREDDLGSWEHALEEMSGYADAPHRKEYAHRVFALLARGGTFEGRDGEAIVLAPHDLPPTLTLDVKPTLRARSGRPDYPDAEWIPTSCNDKCNTSRYGSPIQYVVIHDTEGGWDASVATLQNDPGKSVQYIVGVDGRVAQFVPESYTAWHGGNSYYNQRSVGIEHVGYATKAFPEPLYEASAKLVAYLTKKYNVPRDRAHVIGHDQIPDGGRIASSSPACDDAPKACNASGNYGGASNHTDPGVWEWCTFMARIGGTCKCNDVTPIWNCSSSKKQAFRCVGGKIEIDRCTAPQGCEVMPDGVDDVCHKANVRPAPGPDHTDPPAPPDPSAPPESPGDPPLAAAPHETGCSTAPGDPGGSAALLVALAATVALRRRR